MKTKLTTTVLLFLSFLSVGVMTLPKYGINWDTINHLPRGQAFLHYFLTGRGDYSDLPPFIQYWQDPRILAIDSNLSKSQSFRRSYYQSDATTFNWFMIHDGGHPPLSDILSSVFNVIFFQKLGLINDIDAYRVYGIFLSASLVTLVFWWTSSMSGKVGGLVAALSLGTYPLFWSESHFNTEKDIPEAVFLSFFIFCIWKAFKEFKQKWLVASGIFLGLALGTKFNAVFAPFIVAPWVIFIVVKNRWHVDKKTFLYKRWKFLISCSAIPIIAFAIFVLSWPYLWADPLTRLSKVVEYYRGIGLTTTFDKQYLGFAGINAYPAQAILYSSPIPTLLFFLLGVIYISTKITKKQNQGWVLCLIWFVVAVGRVTLPGMSIYGGLRQIMEYIPAMGMIAGLGGEVVYRFISSKLKNSVIALIFVLIIFVPHIYKLIRIHPNENVYFNELMGGLSTAREKEFLFWGNSFGAAYRQGVVWLNANAPYGVKVVMARELMPNIPAIWFRPDIDFHNSQRSGYLQKGEYVIGLTYQGTKDYSYYDGFLDTFVKPVYEVKVDNTAILKIWQNDKSHLAFDLRETLLKETRMKTLDDGLRFDLGEEHRLSRLEIDYNEFGCRPLNSGVVRLSNDGEHWQTLVGVLPKYWRIAVLGQQPADGKFIEPFYGQVARYIDLVLSPEDTCLKKVTNYKVYHYNY